MPNELYYSCWLIIGLPFYLSWYVPKADFPVQGACDDEAHRRFRTKRDCFHWTLLFRTANAHTGQGAQQLQRKNKVKYSFKKFWLMSRISIKYFASLTVVQFSCRIKRSRYNQIVVAMTIDWGDSISVSLSSIWMLKNSQRFQIKYFHRTVNVANSYSSTCLNALQLEFKQLFFKC